MSMDSTGFRWFGRGGSAPAPALSFGISFLEKPRRAGIGEIVRRAACWGRVRVLTRVRRVLNAGTDSLRSFAMRELMQKVSSCSSGESSRLVFRAAWNSDRAPRADAASLGDPRLGAESASECQNQSFARLRPFRPGCPLRARKDGSNFPAHRGKPLHGCWLPTYSEHRLACSEKEAETLEREIPT